MEYYVKFTFLDNNVENGYCPKLIKAVLPKTNKSRKRFVDTSRNKMNFVSTFSAIEIRFGRYRISDDEIGVIRRRTINSFG